MYLKIFNMIKNNQGFSLVEAVASIVLITIALLSFYSLFISSFNTANYNNDKLIAINLAEAELERIKLSPFETGNLPPVDYSVNYNQTIRKTKEIYSGGDTYDLEIIATQNNNEKNNKLINVIVTVEYNGKKSTVEGYVIYE
ncbi:type IV pilus modification PilV family protein [Ureibacillus thermophilus]|uniref:Prepilin-type N-terminal cleavage/methylation domain-containing protein n=1 Tax=Ureibacillus thermophilus TaxID=367743 RepID=A0A4P6UUY8_9BACL|nr:prepilin-type N-terminal cleavage/methylation domain-containing protein [Ureibacillus thermophilus]QBK25728.1 hypothetical protein DKZ56_07540 [Ureibacillus thermophilus]